MRPAIGVVLVLRVLLPVDAWSSDTVIYLSSPACLRLELPLAEPFTVDIKARGMSGFAALEFAVTGFSPAQGLLVLDVTPNSLATSAVGNPFAEGAKISFADCQGSPDPVTLYTATVVAFMPNPSLQFMVTGHSAPTDPSFQCPTAMECGTGTPVRACAFDLGFMEHEEPPPSAPYPADGATAVPLDVRPVWQAGGIDCNCLGLVCYSLWLGEDPEPQLVSSGCDEPFPDLDLQPLTTYYWRVQVTNCGSGTSPLWSFTTGTSIATEKSTWGVVKRLYR